MEKATMDSERDLMTRLTEAALAAVQRGELNINDLPEYIERMKKVLFPPPPPSADQLNLPLLRDTSNPAVPIEESVHDDYIICLEDGEKLKTLKRHLLTKYNMSVEQYKLRWKLPHDYPTVAPSYSRMRSAIAGNIGLGQSKNKGRTKKIRNTEINHAS
jgi:predicted transcriptional regulator